VGIELAWTGTGVDEKGIVASVSGAAAGEVAKGNARLKPGDVLVEVDPKYFRPAEVDQLLGDPSKAKRVLGWNPHKTSFEDLVKIMVRHDMKKVRKLYLREHLDD
jgi:GDPmannose 4,6-dehydratase